MPLPEVGRVAALLGLLDPPDPQHDPEDVRQLADEILARARYREPPRSTLERIQDAVGDFFSDVGSAVGFGGGGAGWLSWLVLLALAGLLGVLVVWAVRNGGWRRRGPRARGDDAVVVDTEEGRPARGWLREADAHEAAGRWREGLLCRYRALVTGLVEADLIPATPGRTAGEYVRDVRAQLGPESPPTAAFTAATDLFETAWYGGVETGPSERDEFERLAGRVLEASRL
jgi:uncharacterized protein DUF4129